MKRAFSFMLLLMVVVGLTACVSLRTQAYATLSGQGGQHKPAKLTENFYYVGTSDIAVYLMVTDDGLILFDTAYEHMHDMIASNIRTAGFDPNDIKVILNTQAHMDHAGGIEKMRLLSGAEVKARAKARNELLVGSRNDFSPLIRFMPYSEVKFVTELKEPQLHKGSTSINWYKTPGHTKGCTSYSLKLIIQGVARDVVIVCGFRRLPFTAIENNERYSNIKTDYAQTINVLRKLKENCDILLAPHMGDFKTKLTITELKDGEYNFSKRRCQIELDSAIEKINERILQSK